MPTPTGAAVRNTADIPNETAKSLPDYDALRWPGLHHSRHSFASVAGDSVLGQEKPRVRQTGMCHASNPGCFRRFTHTRLHARDVLQPAKKMARRAVCCTP
ncbi:hypothetical protein, partial [Xanthomonas vasicola]|uniref:hypothetical protein n=3 Tax=Xanthomonas vasicola TaxID=56459 RepID=UPI001FEEC1C8